MRAVVLYHPKSEHGGVVQDYARDFKRFKNKEMELISLETREGAELAKLYDITSYPAVMTIQDSGQLLKLWQGGSLPLLNDLDANFQNR